MSLLRRFVFACCRLESLRVGDAQQVPEKSEAQFRTCLTQTGAKLASDFILTLASATQEKKKKSKDTQSSTLGKERVVVKRSCFFLEPVCQKVRFSELAKAKPSE